MKSSKEEKAREERRAAQSAKPGKHDCVQRERSGEDEGDDAGSRGDKGEPWWVMWQGSGVEGEARTTVGDIGEEQQAARKRK
jgi:hypothetical protein